MLWAMPDADSSRSHRRLELVATFLLAFATLGTAWSAYQAREWTGEQSQGYSRATKNRIAVNRESAIANRQVQIDVATFVQWVDAQERGNTKLADFYRERFRDEFEPAFAAWLATKPLTNASAPETPFAMPQYRLAAAATAKRLDTESEASAATVLRNIQRASDCVLAVVLFAIALFFAGLGSKLRVDRIRAVMVVLAGVIFLGTVIWIATFPVSLAV